MNFPVEMTFENFLESLDNVPPELKRNFFLMTDLDKRTEDIMKRINCCVRDYKRTKKAVERQAIKKESANLFEKLSSYSEDKIELALQTYEMIDKCIKKLVSLNAPSANIGDKRNVDGDPLIGYDMPLDPNEPKYCICREASHGDMIACDNKECSIEWFHYSCVNINEAPKGKWYCGNCYKGAVEEYRKMKKKRRR